MFLLQRTIAVLCIAAAADAAAQDLAATLREGGVTIYFRHAATDHSQADRDDEALADCSRQRNLSDAGRRDARAIGDALRAIGVRIGEVLASPYCRTLETARLIAERATPSRDVLGHMTPGGAPDYSPLDAILARPPPEAGTVRIVVAHGNQYLALGGPPELGEGEAALIRGDGQRWRTLARIKPPEWSALAGGENKKGP